MIKILEEIFKGIGILIRLNLLFDECVYHVDVNALVVILQLFGDVGNIHLQSNVPKRNYHETISTVDEGV